MTAPGNSVLLTALIVAFAVSTGYAAGRIHQWYRTSLERDEAYRDGYDMATRSLFSLAARIVRPRRSEKAAARGTAKVDASTATGTVTSILAAPGAAMPPGKTAGTAGRTAAQTAGRIAAETAGRIAAETAGGTEPATPRRPVAAAPSDGVVPVVPGTESATPAAGGGEGRHTLPDELVHAPTYRLSPDRIARAKVPPHDLPGEKTRIVSVPKPRAS